MSIITHISKIKGNFSSDNGNWVHYIKDHRNFILKNSTNTPISKEDMRVYQYRPEALFKFLGFEISMSWIILWINQVTSILDFTDIESLKIPPLDLISELYRSFNTFQANVENLLV